MRAPVALVDIDTDPSGDVTGRLRAYDETINRSLIERSVAAFAASFPPARST